MVERVVDEKKEYTDFKIRLDDYFETIQGYNSIILSRYVNEFKEISSNLVSKANKQKVLYEHSGGYNEDFKIGAKTLEKVHTQIDKLIKALQNYVNSYEPLIKHIESEPTQNNYYNYKEKLFNIYNETLIKFNQNYGKVYKIIEDIEIKDANINGKLGEILDIIHESKALLEKYFFNATQRYLFKFEKKTTFSKIKEFFNPTIEDLEFKNFKSVILEDLEKIKYFTIKEADRCGSLWKSLEKLHESYDKFKTIEELSRELENNAKNLHKLVDTYVTDKNITEVKGKIKIFTQNIKSNYVEIINALMEFRQSLNTTSPIYANDEKRYSEIINDIKETQYLLDLLRKIKDPLLNLEMSVKRYFS